MVFKPEDFGGDRSPEEVVPGLVVGIVDDCINSVAQHVDGLSEANAFGITMSAVDHLTATVISHYADDDWEAAEMMVARHCGNVLRRLLEAQK